MAEKPAFVRRKRAADLQNRTNAQTENRDTFIMDYRPGGGGGGGRECDALGPPPGAFWEVIKGEPLTSDSCSHRECHIKDEQQHTDAQLSAIASLHLTVMAPLFGKWRQFQRVRG